MPDGTEILTFWVAIPDQGKPMLEGWGSDIGGRRIELNSSLEMGTPVILRSVRIAPVIVRPVIEQEDNWVAIEQVNFQIKVAGSGINEVEMPRRSRAFDQIIRSFVVNPPEPEGVDEFDQEHLLVVVPDFIENNIAPFVEWKRRKGLECTLSTLSDIGISAYNAEGLKDYIREAYDTWENPPDFVLFAGDETVLPFYMDYTDDPPTMFSTASVPGMYPDENWFVCVDGDDYFPDLILGRWVVDTAFDYQILQSKVMRYEMMPTLYQTDWYTQAVVAAQDSTYFQGDPSMRATKMEAREMMLNFGFDRVDTLFTMNNPYQMTLWINDGRSYVNYRGAGWSMGWAGINWYFDQFEYIENSFMLPVVTGIGCGVGLFLEPDGTCFGEIWMLLGDPFDHKGAISFIGPGHNTHTYYNDELDKGIYQSAFVDEEPRIGASLIAGKLFMYDYFDDYFQIDPNVEEIVRVAFGQYYLLSDPELKPYNSFPAELHAEFPATILTGSQQVSVTVTDGLGQPFEGAVVCLYLPGDFQAADLTDPNGMVDLTTEASLIPAYVYATVTAHNHAPVLDSILVITESQYVLHRSSYIDDNLAGNGDGALSPGESAEWTEILQNYGITLAPDVGATLSSDHPLVTISQGEATYGNIASGDSATGIPDYELSVAAESYTIGDEMLFTVDIRDGMDSTWTSELIFPLITPALSVISITPDPSGNGRLDRGELCSLAFAIRNQGTGPVSDGWVILESNDPYVNITQDSIHCGEIGVNASFYSGQTPFYVHVNAYTPTLHEVVFWLKLISDESTYSFADSTWFSLEVGEYGAADPTPDLSETYYAYESLDTLYSEAPNYEWFEIDPQEGGPGAVLPITYDAQIMTMGLPFQFQYWGEEYTHVTICADGWIMPGITSSIPPDNYNIPYQDDVPGMIAGLWDNLWNSGEETGRISTFYDETNGRYYVEYNNVSHQSGTIPKETFQIVLCDPEVEPTTTGDGEILFYYKSLHFFGITFSTVGIEDPSQYQGIELSYNNITAVTAHGVSDSVAIRFTTDPPFMVAVEPEPNTGSYQIPSSFSFDSPYPNPFNPKTSLSFAIPTRDQVELMLYNVRGQRVATLLDLVLDPGYHVYELDAANLGSGIYFARMQYKNQAVVQKLLLLK
jgi:hypothetical protein